MSDKKLPSAKVKQETCWYVECPECESEHSVDAYEDGVIECVCGIKFEYDNRHPEKAEIV